MFVYKKKNIILKFIFNAQYLSIIQFMSMFLLVYTTVEFK